MYKINKGTLGLLLLTSGIIASCKVTKTYKAPVLQTKGLYRDATATDSINLATADWKTIFPDTILQRLITTGLENNLDLKLAVARIEESGAAFKLSKAAFLPSLSGNADVKQSRLSYPQGFGLFRNTTQYDLGLSSNWELDIWGKLNSTKKAALADYLATDAAKRAVQTRIVSGIALNYFALLALDKQLEITILTVQNRTADVKTMNTLLKSSIVTGAAVVQSQGNLYEAELAIPDLQQKIRETENAISILLGKVPGPVKRTKLEDQKLFPDLKTGFPDQILANRPDIQQAEYVFRAAFENTNVARTQFYPSLTITATGGFSSFGWNQWISNPSLFGNIAGGILQPILNKGLNKARLTTAESRQQQAFYDFQLSLLKAGEEVSNALFAYQTAAGKQTKRNQQIESLTKAVQFTRQLLNYNANTNYTDVLTSEQNLLTAQLNAVTDQTAKFQAMVNLYSALGGGWR